MTTCCPCQSAVSKYSHASVGLSSKVTRASEVLGLIETERMVRSAIRFPLKLKMAEVQDDKAASEAVGNETRCAH